MKVCSEPRCPNLVERGKCDGCRKTTDKARGTRQERGYGVAHERLRAQWKPKVATGQIKCWRCGKRITALQPWDLGHDDEDRTKYRGPEHVHCNRATSGR